MLFRFRNTFYFVDEQGRVYNSTKGKFIKLRQRKNGYLAFRIHGSAFYVHRAVFETINKLRIPESFEINHKDGNRTNNCIENLEMLSQKEHKEYHKRLRKERKKTETSKEFMRTQKTRGRDWSSLF